MATDPTHPDDPTASVEDATGTRAAVHDRRGASRGALPRQTQAWIMVGLACLILAVIVLTGQPEPSPPLSVAAPVAPSASVQPERVRSYQDSLAEREARLRALQATPPTDALVVTSPPPVAMATPVDPLIDERRRRDEQSLFADNVAFTRRGSATPPAASASTPVAAPWPYPELVPAPVSPAPAASTPSDHAADASTGASSATPAPATVRALSSTASAASMTSTESGPPYTLLEGTVIESVLINRLDGTFQGPVQCLVTTPVYSHDRQAVVIPAGSRVLGSAAAVQAWGDRRLAVRFHRLLLPDSRAVSLESFTGLNQIGETGLTDEVDRHYLQVFGASLAIGAISGLAQFGTRAGYDMTAIDASRQAAGASLATSTARVLDRYLNVLPTITIREGHRIKIVLTNDLHLPPYPRTTAAGSPPPAALSSVSRPRTSGGSR
jgi:type IV secretion system protein VirB10